MPHLLGRLFYAWAGTAFESKGKPPPRFYDWLVLAPLALVGALVFFAVVPIKWGDE